jgi:ABC-type glutathione transport system ATPase component
MRSDKAEDLPRAVEARLVSKRYVRSGVAVVALQPVSFVLDAGRTLVIVGESGAGKSTIVQLLAGLEAPTTGTLLVDGRTPRLRSGQVSDVQVVFQDPFASFNERKSIGWSVGEALRADRREAALRVQRLLAEVGVEPDRAGERPRRFSGGQLQRVALARALAAEPQVLLCDEPTSALDVSVQAQILNLIKREQRRRGFACALVTHDLQVARAMADDVLVLRGGAVVEQGPADKVLHRPTSSYLRELLSASGLGWERETSSQRGNAACTPDQGGASAAR